MTTAKYLPMCLRSTIQWVLLALLLQSQAVFAKQVSIAIGLALPPYVIAAEDSGIEVDIIKRAFQAVGYTAHFYYIPNGRIPFFLKNGSVDGVATNNSYDIEAQIGLAMFPTHTTVTYQNFAIAFKNNQFLIETMDDLADKKVVAFQNAARYLGPAYAAMAKKNNRYREHALQHLHVKQLYADRVDVVVSDRRIFMYWREVAKNRGELKKRNVDRELSFYSIFPEAPRNLQLREQDISNDFNAGLKVIRQSGMYQQIINRYEKW